MFAPCSAMHPFCVSRRLGPMKFDESFGSIPFSPKLDSQCSDEERADTAVLMRMRSGLLYDFTCKVRVHGTLMFESRHCSTTIYSEFR